MSEQLEEYMMKPENLPVRKAMQSKKDQVTQKHFLNPSEFPNTYPAVDLYTRACQTLNIGCDPAVAKILENKTLDEILDLEFSGSYMSVASFQALTEFMRCLPKLQSLDFSSTSMKTDSLPMLIECIENHPSLTRLDLSNNQTLGFSAAKLLLPMLKHNKNIIHLGIEGTMMAPATKELVKKVLHHNTQLMEEAQLLSEMKAAKLQLEKQHLTDSVMEELDALESKETGGEIATPTDSAQHQFPQKADAPDVDGMDISVQKNKNLRLHTDLLEHEERLVTWFNEHVEKSEQKPREAKDKMTKGRDLLQKFTEGWKWFMRPEYSIKRMIDDLQLEVDEIRMDEYLKVFTPQDGYNQIPIARYLQELLQLSTGAKRKGKLLEDLSSKILGHGPGIDVLIDIMSSLYDLMHLEDISILSIKNMLANTDDQMGDFVTKIERLESNLIRATDDDDFPLAEQYHEELLMNMEKLLDLNLFRLKQLLNKGSRSHLLANLKVLCQKADDQMNITKSVSEEMSSRITADIAKIKQMLEESERAKKLKDEEFVISCKRVEEELSTITKNQDKCWKDILYACKELADLSVQRYKKIDAHVKEVEAHERRKVEYNGRVDVATKHIDRLVRLRNDTTSTEDIVQHIDDWVRKAAVQIAELTDSVTTEGDQLAMSEQRSYLDNFRKFYICVGNLTDKRELRIVELQRAIRNCEFQLEMAKEMRDPEFTTYKDNLRELNIKHNALGLQIEDLRKRSALRATEFAPHEEALKALGLQFESPLIEKETNTLDIKQKFLVQKRSFAERERTELVDKEEESIAALDTLTKQAKRGMGLSSLIHSLSPTSGYSDGGPRSTNHSAFDAGDSMVKSTSLPKNRL